MHENTDQHNSSTGHRDQEPNVELKDVKLDDTAPSSKQNDDLTVITQEEPTPSSLQDITPADDNLKPSEVTQKPIETAEEKLPIQKRILEEITHYFFKVKGVKGFKNPYKRHSIGYMIVAFIAAFIGIMVICVIHYYAIINQKMDPLSQQSVLGMMIGSFGASAVLIYGEIKSPLSQPRNFVGGHFFSAIVGVLCRLIIEAINAQNWAVPYFAALSVAAAITAMHITRTTHPPGGATALIAATSPLYPWYGFQYLFIPVLSACLIMLIIALIVNNLHPENNYPLYWW